MTSQRFAGKSTFLTWAYIAFLLAFPSSYVFSQEDRQDPYLKPEDLENTSRLHLRHQQATKEDNRFARDLRDSADGAVGRGNWGGAFKTYAGSAMIKPTVEALEGMVISISKMSRERENCTDTLISKARDFSSAFSYSAVALEFSEITGEKIDLLHIYEEIINAQQEVMKRIGKCLDQ